MNQEGKTGSGGFWTSLPAIFGGLAALVTAVGGILVVLNQRGGEPAAAPANPQTAVSAPAAPANVQTAASVPAAASPIWPDISGGWLSTLGATTFTVTDDLRDDEGQVVGKKARGTYALGSIEGELRGFTLNGYWAGEEDGEKCATERGGSWYWGRVEFKFNRAGDKFEGHWGVCDDDPAIRWTGARD